MAPDDTQLDITFGHGARHLAEGGPSAMQVEAAIAADLRRRSLPERVLHRGRVIVEGVSVEYRVYRTGRRRVHVGTYYPL